MENNQKKPIDNIKEDISKVIIMVDKLQKDCEELKEINNDFKNLLAKHLFKVEPIVKNKSWFY